jgi:methylated-DNA-[protein]-cysteine S-methyltransferase
VYALVRCVPKGKVTTYKEIANKLDTAAYRAVGTILKNNPDIPNTPCHRVIKSDRSLGGYMGRTAGLEVDIKMKKLVTEGIVFDSKNKVKTEFIYTF